MAPADDGSVEGSRKEKVVVEKESVYDLTDSLTHLTLQETKPHKDLIKLEHQLASVHLHDTLVQVEDLNNSKNQEKKNERETSEEEDDKEDADRENKDDGVEKDERKNIEHQSTGSEIGKENREQENDTEQEEIKKDGGKEIEVYDNKVKETSQDEPETQEEEEEEGAGSHDENPVDEEDKRNEKPKDRKLRSRGFGHVEGHGYSAGPYADSMSASTYQQPFQCQMSPQHSQQYPGPWVPQYGQMPEASVSHPFSEWYGNTSSQQDSLSSPSFISSLAEYSPASSCASSPQAGGDIEAGYETDRPLHYDATGYSTNYVYQDYSSSPPCMSPALSSSEPNSFPSLLTPPVSPQPASTRTPKPDDAAAAAAPDDSYVKIIKVINSVMQEGNFDISPYDQNIIEIKKNLLDIGNFSPDIEEDLDFDLYHAHFKQFAMMTNEYLVKADKDGDILYMMAACRDQSEKDYKERLVAFTDRVEKMELCCDRVVDRKIHRCEVCGQSDPEQFYSPLSWINNHGQMLLPNLVHLKFPAQVVEYITKKIMNRQMDFVRTFRQHGDLLLAEAGLYPCLMKGITKLTCG